MTVTVIVNKLTLCHKDSGGVSEATLPDVCNTPSGSDQVPIAYRNIAYSRDLEKGTTTVKADGGNMCAKFGSEFSTSTGDEPGSGGGVKSGTFIKEATWITFSFDVKFEGRGACRLTDKMFHNHYNTANISGLQQINLRNCKDLLDAWNGSKRLIDLYQQVLADKLTIENLNKKVEWIGTSYDGLFGKGTTSAGQKLPPIVQEAIREVEQNLGTDEALYGAEFFVTALWSHYSKDKTHVDHTIARREIERQNQYQKVLERKMKENGCPTPAAK